MSRNSTASGTKLDDIQVKPGLDANDARLFQQCYQALRTYPKVFQQRHTVADTNIYVDFRQHARAAGGLRYRLVVTFPADLVVDEDMIGKALAPFPDGWRGPWKLQLEPGTSRFQVVVEIASVSFPKPKEWE
jgi:hypothetical protein